MQCKRGKSLLVNNQRQSVETGAPDRRAVFRIIIEKFHKESMGGEKLPEKHQKAANGFDRRRKTDGGQTAGKLQILGTAAPQGGKFIW